MIWFLAALVLLLLIGGYAFWQTISRNGPLVVDKIDRVTGGTDASRELAIISTGPSEAQELIIYGPAQSQQQGQKLPVIIFVHGGGWHSGSVKDYRWFARGLVPEGFVVVLAGYRLFPEAQFPSMLNDTADAIAWTHANIAEYGGDPDAIILSGHSAGAYNVVMTALDQQWLAKKELDDTAIKGVVGLAGPYDFYPFDNDSTRNSFGSAPNPAQTTQPIAHVRGDAPPMLLMAGNKDNLVKPRNSIVLGEAIRAAGGEAETVILEGIDHYNIVLATASPWRRNREVIAQISDFAHNSTGATAGEIADRPASGDSPGPTDLSE